MSTTLFPICTLFSSLPLAYTTLSGGGLISLLIWLLVLALVIYVVFLVIGMLPLPDPAKKIVTIILAIIFLLVLLNRFGITL